MVEASGVLRVGREAGIDGRRFVADIGFDASKRGCSSRGLLVIFIGGSRDFALDVVRRNLPRKEELLRENGFRVLDVSGGAFCK